MLGTLVSTLAISIWLDPVILYRKKFEIPVIRYFVKLAFFLAEAFVAFVISMGLASLIGDQGIIPMIIRAIISFAVTNVVYLIFNCRSRAFAFLYDKGMMLIKKKQGAQ